MKFSIESNRILVTSNSNYLGWVVSTKIYVYNSLPPNLAEMIQFDAYFFDWGVKNHPAIRMFRDVASVPAVK